MHSTHRFFIGVERAFYLLVLDACADDQENQLSYWLRFIAKHGNRRHAAVAGDGEQQRAPVLILITKCDKLEAAKCGSVENSHDILCKHAILSRSLEYAKENDYFGANVLDTIDGIGWFSNESESDLLSAKQKDLIATRHQEACEDILSVIRICVTSVIGLRARVPMAEMRIREWILSKFQPIDGEQPLNQFRYDQPAFREWCVEHGLDRDATEVVDPKHVLEDRIKNALRVLKSVGLVHWIGDLLADRGLYDHEMSNRVFNPSWLKAPVYRVIRAPGMDVRGGWISNEQLTDLLPTSDVAQSELSSTESCRQAEVATSLTVDDRRHILEIMQASELIYSVTKGSSHHGWIIPDRLVARKHLPKTPTPADATGNKWLLQFLPDRVLLRFLGEQVVRRFGEWDRIDEQRLEQLRKALFRNFAHLPYFEGDVEYLVEIQTEINPTLDQQPWISIYVTGGPEINRMIVFQRVRDQINEIMEGEGLEGLSEIKTAPIVDPVEPINVAETYEAQVPLSVIVEKALPPLSVERSLHRLAVFSDDIRSRLKSDSQRAFWDALWSAWLSEAPIESDAKTVEGRWVSYNELIKTISSQTSVTLESTSISRIKASVLSQIGPILRRSKLATASVKIIGGGKGNKPQHYRLALTTALLRRLSSLNEVDESK